MEPQVYIINLSLIKGEEIQNEQEKPIQKVML